MTLTEIFGIVSGLILSHDIPYENQRVASCNILGPVVSKPVGVILTSWTSFH